MLRLRQLLNLACLAAWLLGWFACLAGLLPSAFHVPRSTFEMMLLLIHLLLAFVAVERAKVVLLVSRHGRKTWR